MLKNLSRRFDALEDRILLRLVSDEGEQQLQLTRRVCARWRQDLQQLVATSAQAPARLDAVAQTHLAAAHHQAMAAQATTMAARVRVNSCISLPFGPSGTHTQGLRGTGAQGFKAAAWLKNHIFSASTDERSISP